MPKWASSLCRLSMTDISTIRQRFADDIRQKSNVQSDALVVALAAVPRERFLGSGPWHIGMMVNDCMEYRVTGTGDPAEVYCDSVIAIDPARGLNNGEPSSLARWIDVLSLKQGETVIHVGGGTGYYTALLAHIVGRTGRVIAYEVDPTLAERARINLRDYSQACVVSGNSYELPVRGVDAMFVNCGITHPAMEWLTSLSNHGRILMPITSGELGETRGFGGMYLGTRADGNFSLAYVSGVGIFHCTGQRNEQLNLELQSKPDADWQRPRSLRLDLHEKVESCWLHGHDCCMSTLLPYPSSAAQS